MSLTDYGQFDILQSGPGWQGQNAIRSTETSRRHHAARRCGGVAAGGARTAARADAAHRRAHRVTASPAPPSAPTKNLLFIRVTIEMSCGIDQSYGANVEAHWYVGRYVLPGNVQKVILKPKPYGAGRLPRHLQA